MPVIVPQAPIDGAAAIATTGSRYFISPQFSRW
jgi:hypothetical protein